MSHRLGIAKAAIKENYDVYLLTKKTMTNDEIESYGINVIDFNFSRSGTNIFREFSIFIGLLIRIYRLDPDIIHAVTIKPVIYSGLIAKLFGKNIVLAISGLGHFFTHTQDSINHLFKNIFLPVIYRIIFSNKKSIAIFQNNDDLNELQRYSNSKSLKSTLIKGSGVDLVKFHPLEYRGTHRQILMASRILKDKGVIEFITAAKLLKIEDPSISFLLAGPIDEENPSRINLAELEKLIEDKIEYVGNTSDMPRLYQSSSIFVLPSYREGMPLAVLEASACGLPIITTDVPGCRDSIKNNYSGLLIPPRDSNALFLAMRSLINDDKSLEKFSSNSARFAKENFDIIDVINKHINIYKSFNH